MAHNLVNTLNVPSLPILSFHQTLLAKPRPDELNYLPSLCALVIRVTKQDGTGLLEMNEHPSGMGYLAKGILRYFSHNPPSPSP